jgi:type I restriction enzyme S subunit
MTWHTVSVDSVIRTLESGSRPKGGVSSDRGDVPSLGGENILTSGGVTLNDLKLVPAAFYAKMTKGRLEDGDVLINKDGAQTGKIGWYRSLSPQPASINEHLFLLRGIPGRITQGYLYYTLLSEAGQNQIRRQISGSAQPGLKSDFAKGVITDIPEAIDEQATVVEIVSTVDRAIEQTEMLITKQRHIKTGLMQALLTRGVDERGNLRSEQSHQFKDSPLGRIPVEWSVGRLGDNCEVRNNLRKPLSAQMRSRMSGDYPYYGPTGVLDYINEYRVEGQHVLLGEDGDHFLKFLTQEMTLLVDGKYNVNNHAHVIRGKGNVLTEWLHLFFLHRDITLYLTRQGAGRLKLNKAALLGLPMSAPKNPGEQQSILQIIDACRLVHSDALDTLGKLRSLKNGLIQDLLSGRRRVIALLGLPA